MEAQEPKQTFEREKKLEFYLRERIEEKAYKKIAENMLYLANEHAVKSEIANLFTCAGYDEEQDNQQGHDFMILTPGEIVAFYFNEALDDVNMNEVEKVWRQFVIQSFIPPHPLQKIMQDEDLVTGCIIKCNETIKRFVGKIDDARMNLFV